MTTPGSTGTVYGLRDPRDGITRYVGATTKTLPDRLTGHLSGKAAPRVRAWVTELRAAGLRPEIYAISNDVPVDELLAAEGDEITRVIVSGGTLLNENGTARGRNVLQDRREARHVAADLAAWQELAATTRAVLGGPIPPTGIAGMEIPDETWDFMAKIPPGHNMNVSTFLGSDYPHETWKERHQAWEAFDRDREPAVKLLHTHARSIWSNVLCVSDRDFRERLGLELSIAVGIGHASREDASRHMSLIVWYLVAVYPWWHLADLAGMAEDDASFIAWAGRNAAVRKALAFLTGFGGGLAQLSKGHDSPDEIGPGHRLATVAAAYSGSPPPKPARSIMQQILDQYANDHMLTQPMADLLLLMDPSALDSIFGKDIAAEIDRELGLASGTSGRVLRALVEHTGQPRDRDIRHAVDRSTQTFPVRALPEYGGGWTGRGVPTSRVISASLVRAGLATPAEGSPKEYVAKVCALWTPGPVPAELRRSA